MFFFIFQTLEYGFFPEATPRQPTDEEILGLLEQTSAFYEEVVRAVYPTVIGFQATYVTDEFRPENTDLPIFIEFDANAFFPEGMTLILLMSCCCD